MTRRRVMTDDEIKRARAEHRPGVRGYGYGSLAKKYKVGESTMRDALLRYVRPAI